MVVVSRGRGLQSVYSRRGLAFIHCIRALYKASIDRLQRKSGGWVAVVDAKTLSSS